jgi:hypothetical protein
MIKCVFFDVRIEFLDELRFQTVKEMFYFKKIISNLKIELSVRPKAMEARKVSV